MALNFNDVLSKNLSDVERPPLMPVGTYRWVIYKIPSMDTMESANGTWDTVDIPLKCIAPTDDVDPEALQAYGGEIKGAVQTLRFMFDKADQHKFDETLFRLKRFLNDHVGVDGGNIKEALNATVNKQVLATIKWQPDRNDPELFHANIGKTAPIG